MAKEWKNLWGLELLLPSSYPKTVDYMDDIIISGMNTLYKLWPAIKKTTTKLVGSGMLLNVWKSCLLVPSATILSFGIERVMLSLGKKSLCFFFASKLPVFLK